MYAYVNINNNKIYLRGNSMQKQPPWDKYEEALLIQAYLSMQIGNVDYESISNTLSLQLRACKRRSYPVGWYEIHGYCYRE